ncbi:NHLP bacteriocin export ABC transporter permease/ATPase subunit [Nodosilinea sp. PGN35]|uniref:NHLP bacteriocin export ABC transporter permease/ATPase subunit n=1 Tax=Nodosilinea sp. PGN35 TaxID=3020489 RepID=UPI0023B2CF28|nr:NHLP bacteriocin export ABC transporter permease/ATPase subunit [Nodosilinea sp. TSF1-S3]MDF0364820.1 NHLP bacteriocin export ABC transporter permease/ATPase subunit [Nodosilinea sp. TSF1-S3]
MLPTTVLAPRTITANQPLLLTNPSQLWQVKAGRLAVFAVPFAAGQPRGDRHYLFTAGPGEALFAADICPVTGLGLLAVAIEPAEVTALPLSEADDTGCPTPLLRALIDPWIHHWGAIEGFPKPAQSGLVPEIHYISLTRGQICRPDTEVLWIRMQQGTATWMGNPAFRLMPELGCFPLGRGTYMQAQDHIEFFARPTAEVTSRRVLIRGLAQLHRYGFSTLEQIDAHNQRLGLKRFHQRQQLNQVVTENVVHSLAGVLDSDPRDSSESPLLAVAGAVGKALGVTILPAAASENAARMKEPLEAIARASQLRLRRVLLRGDWWRQDCGPLVAYTKEGRSPVALLPTSACRYEIYAPGGLDVDKSVGHRDLGRSRQAIDEHDPRYAPSPDQNPKSQIQNFWVQAGQTRGASPSPHHPLTPSPHHLPLTPALAARLDPVAFVFYRPLPAGDLNALSLLRFAFRGQGRDWLMIGLTGVAATLIGMGVPQATAVLVDTVVPYGDRALLWQIGLGLLAAAFGAASFQLAQAIATLRVETGADAHLQAAVWDRLLTLHTSFFRQYPTGDLASRVSSISAIRRQLSGSALQGVFAGVFSLLNLGLLIYYSPLLAGVAVLVGLLVLAVTVGSGLVLVRRYRPLLERQGQLYGLVVQLINGIAKLRMAGAEERAFAAWGQRYGQQLRLTLSTQQLEDGVAVFNTVLPVVTTGALFWLASLMLNGDTDLSVGRFLAFSVAFGTFIAGATSLSDTLVDLLDVVPLWQRASPILHAEPEVNLSKADPGQLSGALSVDRVTFRYRDEGPVILDDVSFAARPGEFIALVGPSGSGKSTAMRLLLGFDQPQAGAVYYDGQALSGLDVVAVRRQCGVVLQTSRLSAGSIFENLAGGALISLDDAWDAAEKAGLAADLRAMPMQMHTVVSEGGSNLSGGQRQRLLIARALAVKPKIMLMDEATSALDNRTQAIVTESLNRLKVTRVVIAHRLSTIRHADRIYVLEAGRVVQQGRFEELAGQPGLFSQLIRRQMT